MNLTDLHHNNHLSHANLLVTDEQTAQTMIDQFIQDHSISPADYLLLNSDQSIKVAEARELRRFAEMSRFTSPFKLGFINQAHRLTPEAANALLKLFEEPPAHTYLFLATPKPESLLATVRSRCRHHWLATEPLLLEAPSLLNQSLAEYFQLAQQLAAKDTPLTHYFEAWLQSWAGQPPSHQLTKAIQLALNYLPACQTSANRRLLLDNFFLDLYEESS